MKTVSYTRTESYSDMMVRLYPELHHFADKEERILSKTVTFQVCANCNLACTYCYEINKQNKVMSFETAKKVVDRLFDGEKGFHDYINPEISPAIILEFIGGEPFLQVKLIDQIIDYFRLKALELNHPWADKFRVSICSNGTLNQTDEVKAFLAKHRHHLSFSVTVDGNKALHDSCRVFPDGRGSYDLAIQAVKDWIKLGGVMGSKITIAPANVAYLSDALKDFIKFGYTDIHANCVYEDGWTVEHAHTLYEQMKIVSDYMLDNDLIDKVYCSLYEEEFFHPKAEDDVQTWCGGSNDSMLAIDPDGYLFPCIRYMETSLGSSRPPMRIGHVDDGIATTPEYQRCHNCMQGITRRTQSTDECFYCPIAEGCSNCSGYDYQCFGTPNSRATYICVMHKARSLANAYHWNSYYRKNSLPYRFKIYLPEEEALKIVSKDEWALLKALESEK